MEHTCQKDGQDQHACNDDGRNDEGEEVFGIWDHSVPICRIKRIFFRATGCWYGGDVSGKAMALFHYVGIYEFEIGLEKTYQLFDNFALVIQHFAERDKDCQFLREIINLRVLRRVANMIC